MTADGKPLVVVQVQNLSLLQTRSRELQALRQIFWEAKELQSDRVAHREVRHRLMEAERLLDETLAMVLSESRGDNTYWVGGAVVPVTRTRQFQAHLSDLCDRTYCRSLVLDNELINRRELTSQGTKARRQLITAMLEAGTEPRLGLQGYGPEVAIYASVLAASGIHAPSEEGRWGFGPPKAGSGLGEIWDVMEGFCTGAIDRPRSLETLYQILEKPPHGVRSGVIPVLLGAVLLYHQDDVGVYQDGTYVPVLGVEHFELLMRDPDRFGVKSFAIAGLRSQLFQELETVLKSPQGPQLRGVRNSTLLTVVNPLYQFAKKLPRYTQQTHTLSPEAQGLLRGLQKTVEPDELLFVELPRILGLESLAAQPPTEQAAPVVQELRDKLVTVLREIHGAYDRLLAHGQQLLGQGFGIRQEQARLREDLRVRSSRLIHHCLEPLLRRFMLAAMDETVDDRHWLESLLMIVGDKPAEAWTDQDVLRFEANLGDLVRRFQNLEALQGEMVARGEGLEARRITVTRPDGHEEHRVIWLDQRHGEGVHDRFEAMV